jgi:branched-chain amino acid transport system permease protein
MEVSIALILQELISGLTLGAVYVAIALGLTLVYGILQILHIAHAGIYVAGAYLGFVTYILTHNLILTFLVAATGAAAIGLAIERFLYMPVLEQPRHIPLMISIAVFILIEELIANIAGHHPKGFHISISNKMFKLGGVSITEQEILFMLIVYTLSFTTWLIFDKTKIGLASKALIQDMEVAEAMGVNAIKIIDFNFLIGSALAGIAGVLVGIYYTNIQPHMGDVVAYEALAVIVLGGFGSIAGAVIGGLILGISEAYLAAFLGTYLPRDAFAFLIMILMLIFRPQGLFGRVE